MSVWVGGLWSGSKVRPKELVCCVEQMYLQGSGGRRGGFGRFSGRRLRGGRSLGRRDIVGESAQGIDAATIRSVEGRADDAGSVAVLSWHDGCSGLEQCAVLVNDFADAAAEDDQIGPQIGLDAREVLVELVGPSLPAQPPAL